MILPASSCYVAPSDLPLSGSPCKFCILTADAGRGTLNITTQGPGKTEVKISDEGKGIYLCELTPSLPGSYNVNITWDDQPIQGSPYKLCFGEYEEKAITGFDLRSRHFQIGVKHLFKVHCNNAIQGEVLQVKTRPPSAAEVAVFAADNSTYSIEMVPKEEGHHQVVILYGDTEITDSPFNVTFYQKSRLLQSSIEESESGEDIAVFIVTTKGAGEGILTASARNRSNGCSPQVVVRKTNEEFKYRVFFPFKVNTKYLLSIKYDDEHIEESPFNICFDPAPNPNACRAYGVGLKCTLVDESASFDVSTAEAGPGRLSVMVISEDTTATVPELLEVGRDLYRCLYTPNKPGNYTIEVKWTGQHIPSSPFQMTCYPSPARPSPFSITDHPDNCVVGEDIVFTATSSDMMDEQNELMVFAESHMGMISGRATSSVIGASCCVLKPASTGMYTVRAFWNGVELKGSPFQVKVCLPSRPDLVKASGPGLRDGFVGQEGNFTLETREAGSGILDVRVQGPMGAFKINMRQHPDDDRTILARYDPRHIGEYTISITWSNKHIPNSPFKVKIREQRRNRASATKPETATVPTAASDVPSDPVNNESEPVTEQVNEHTQLTTTQETYRNPSVYRTL